jgi:hypothetical protein
MAIEMRFVMNHLMSAHLKSARAIVELYALVRRFLISAVTGAKRNHKFATLCAESAKNALPVNFGFGGSGVSVTGERRVSVPPADDRTDFLYHGGPSVRSEVEARGFELVGLGQ